MRKGISIAVTAEDRVWLDLIIRNRNSPQKHVWRAGTCCDRRRPGHQRDHPRCGKGKSVVWRWQERFMREGIEGLPRDKTRPSRRTAAAARPSIGSSR